MSASSSSSSTGRSGGSCDEDKVFQGLQKKQQCKLCEQVFYVDELPGAISYHSVLGLREKFVKKNPFFPLFFHLN